MSISPCCVKGFTWAGTPTGKVSKLANITTYITGDNPSISILLIHDLFGFTHPNTRLLADHYAREIGATVYVPDFFGSEILPFDKILSGDWSSLDLPGFLARNSREIREPEIFACAKALRGQFKKVGAVGFCYGGWAVLRLAAKEHDGAPLVEAITCGHPSLMVKKDFDEVAVPAQILAPEFDPVYTAELKTHTFETLQKLAVPFDYQHFPGVEHACFMRGDEKKKGELDAMVRGKNAAVSWMKQFLQD
ncbi:dienelactone hydrolase family protein [Amylocarpus encephaloides]|uniref:Dienelactone hydrolase family protein n=1 Tax=Amylocarpus encephaloides TaxID=45428 RepID=A0A9P7Y9G6_9HELO|nr:dienelactone hydrolase family protein [Amylocarpus encephaloides]